jgi:predicted small secreted protein
MKKRMIILLAIVLVFAFALTACGTKPATSTGTKLGFGSVISVAGSYGVGDNTTNATIADGQTYCYLASVIVDSSGKIVNVWIDSIVSDVKFDAAGKLTTDKTKLGSTKRELGDAYGMKKASAIGKEWYQEADALEAWLIGKTSADIDAAKKTDGKLDDLKASVTISAQNYLDAVKKAIANAQ